MQSAELAAVLLHRSTVTAMEWSPAGSSLAVCAGTGCVYMWSMAGASIVHIPLTGFTATGIKWGADGASFVLTNREAFCCAYVSNNC